MEIQGLFKIESMEDPNKRTRELHFTFAQEFKSLAQEQRNSSLEKYILLLKSDMEKTEDSASKQGMLTILQISEQLLPHIKANEIPLEETLVVEMGERAQGSSLTDLINRAKIN